MKAASAADTVARLRAQFDASFSLPYRQEEAARDELVVVRVASFEVGIWLTDLKSLHQAASVVRLPDAPAGANRTRREDATKYSARTTPASRLVYRRSYGVKDTLLRRVVGQFELAAAETGGVGLWPAGTTSGRPAVRQKNRTLTRGQRCGQGRPRHPHCTSGLSQSNFIYKAIVSWVCRLKAKRSL
jgi:hypothetical protein